MKDFTLLGVNLTLHPKSVILEQIKEYIVQPKGFVHVISLNPENLVIALENKEFKKVIETAQITISDGVGIVLAARIKGVKLQEKVAGIDLMETLLDMAGNIRLAVLLIGGRPHLADSIAKCYQQKYPKARFLGTIGFNDIKNPTETEEKQVSNIVRHHKPHLIFAAFGSPEQELWLARNSSQFKGIVCMGVGQGFDVIGKVVKRAPKWVQNIGLEWLYRLITQPWRWRRQLRLLQFLWLVMKEKIE